MDIHVTMPLVGRIKVYYLPSKQVGTMFLQSFKAMDRTL